MTLKGQGHRSIQMAPSDSLWSKTSFCIMVAKVTHSRTSHVQTAQNDFLFIERPQTQANLC